VHQLTIRETIQRLLIAECARLREIDEFWSRCLTDPAHVVHAPGARIERDMALLASAPPAPAAGTFQSLILATSALLTDAVKEALVTSDAGDTEANSFWESGDVVACRSCGGHQTYVIRFDGPCFNPGTLPQDRLGGSASCHLAYVPSDGGPYSNYETLRAYAFACIDPDDAWREARPDLACRSALMRDREAMEMLVDRGRLSGEHFQTRPLPELSTRSDAEISRLKAQLAALRRTVREPHAGD